MADQFSPGRIADRLMIQDVIYKWCRAVDRLDRQGMLDTFHADATERHGEHAGSAAQVVESIMERHRSIPFVSHQVGNILIEFADKDLALVETYMRNIRRFPADSKELTHIAGGKNKPGVGMDLHSAARFLDRFERRLGQWRVTSRTLVVDCRTLVEISGNEPRPSADTVVGRRDREDPVYLARNDMGLG